ncbi:MAG TPA: PhoH family protein [bacterium]|nr:PhoH family protein [bacterium]
MADTVSKQVNLCGVDQVELFGKNDLHLRMLREKFEVKLVARGETLTIEGSEREVEAVLKVLDDLLSSVRKGIPLCEGDVSYTMSMVRENNGEKLNSLHEGRAEYPDLKKLIRAKTVGQQEYVQAMHAYDIVFSIGPAGTGKTYLAMAHAATCLRRRDVDRILLVRPAVEAGESLGFLPGAYEEKVGPYLRPLYDALYEMVPAEKIRKFLEMGVIEVAPLAYMRGRTLNNSFVILDEAQNTTLDQMKMFLTRLGFNSKVVITGDITQIDLSHKEDSGLVQIQSILRAIDGIRFIYLTEKDVVRHRLVQEIIKAFDRFESAGRRPDRRGGR